MIVTLSTPASLFREESVSIFLISYEAVDDTPTL